MQFQFDEMLHEVREARSEKGIIEKEYEKYEFSNKLKIFFKGFLKKMLKASKLLKI